MSSNGRVRVVVDADTIRVYGNPPLDYQAMIQDVYPDHHVEFVRNDWAFDLTLAWFALVGVWPFADPGHSGHTLVSIIDIAIHVTTWIVLCSRWKVVRS